jgi:hypothetical protein
MPYVQRIDGAITSLFSTPQPGYAEEWVEPDSADLLPYSRATVWAKIKAERDRRKASGVRVGAFWFHSDDGSRIQQIALVLMGAGIPAGLRWKTMSGEFVAMTQALANQIFAASAASDQAIFAKAEEHKTAMQSNPDAYNFMAGWPPVFGE